jgi:CRISPR-associated endoribonuclease Cas6
MVPFGYGAPVFPGAPRRRGAYAAGGPGVVEFGSPLPPVVEAWSNALRDRELIDWGGVALRVTGLRAVDPPRFASGRATMRTDTPVVMKTSTGERASTTPWVLPTEAEFPAVFLHNLRRKAETLELSAEIELEAVSWVGPKRSFAVGSGTKPGAAVEVVLLAEPETLRAIWSWGLGQANAAGFGWIGVAR